MSTTDETEILPADASRVAASPDGRPAAAAVTVPVPRRERFRPAGGPPDAGPRRLLTALLLALSVWPM